MLRRITASLALLLLMYGCAQGQSEDAGNSADNAGGSSAQTTSAGGGSAVAGSNQGPGGDGTAGAGTAGSTHAGMGGSVGVGGAATGAGGAAGAKAGASNAGTGGTSSAGGASQGGASAQGGAAQAGQSAAGASQAGAAGTSANPCQGVTCNSPPASMCADANTLGVYAPSGSCDAGTCSYSKSLVGCAKGCVNNQCMGDPCAGVSCNSPPVSVCSDTSHLQVSDAPGTCANGTCTYGNHLAFCSFGCANGVCDGDPCKGMTCSTPPANYCADANNLDAYSSPGTCANGVCSYTNQSQFCMFGCTNGGCMNDPCAGKSCTTPPAGYCTDAMTLRSFGASGTCMTGTCSYPQTDSMCAHGCVNGKCQDCTTTADCPAGDYCNTGSCTSCNVDQHCGSACTDCAAMSEVCDSKSGSCVQCMLDSECGSGKWCSAGTCTACGDAAHCGATCAVCSGATPNCTGGSCQCSGASCGANNLCTGGACAVCASDTSCGSACTACAAPTPKCLAGGTTSSCVACLTTADCTGGNVCSATNTCVAPGCPPPASSCNTTTGTNIGCDGATVIGRKAAAKGSGYYDTQYACFSEDLLDAAGCSDSGVEATYRIYLKKGEKIQITAYTDSDCDDDPDWSMTLAIWSNTGCGDVTCKSQVLCDAAVFSANKSYTATQDGWLIIAVDSPDDFDSGSYELTVKLTCADTGCDCPLASRGVPRTRGECALVEGT